MGTDDQRNRPWLRKELLVGVVLLVALYNGGPSPSGEAGVQLAYLDPGAGSFLIQLLIAAFASGALTLKLHWRRFKRFLGAGEAEAEEENTKRNADSDE